MTSENMEYGAQILYVQVLFWNLTAMVTMNCNLKKKWSFYFSLSDKRVNKDELEHSTNLLKSEYI